MPHDFDSDELLVRYHLGELSPGEQDAVEDRYFADDAFHERVLAAEEELIDSYVRGELSTKQRKHFESWFLKADDHREKLAFAKTLATALREETPTSVREQRSRWSEFWKALLGRRGTLALGGATCVLLVVVSVSYYPLSTRRHENLATKKDELSPPQSLSYAIIPFEAPGRQPAQSGARSLNSVQAKISVTNPSKTPVRPFALSGKLAQSPVPPLLEPPPVLSETPSRPPAESVDVAQLKPPLVLEPAPISETPGRPPAQSIRDGNRVIFIVGRGEIQGLDWLAEPYRSILRRAITEKRIEPAMVLSDLLPKEVSFPCGNCTSREPTPWALEPVATAVEDQRPVFRWPHSAGTTYRVRVYDRGHHMVATSGRISAPEWRILTPLRRGMRYFWQLNVHTNRISAPIMGYKRVFTVPKSARDASFQILGEADEAEITHARSDWGDSHLVVGVLYARAGLLEEAEKELRALSQQNPGSEEVAGLLASVEHRHFFDVPAR